MRKYILLLQIIVMIVFFNCAIATNSNINGIWHATHAIAVPINDGVYYKFNSNGTYTKDGYKSELDSQYPLSKGTYTLSNGKLKLSGESTTWDAYISVNIMYWYNSGIEVLRFTKE
jgi:hypothetical protein